VEHGRERDTKVDPGARGGLGEAKSGGVEEIATGFERRKRVLIDGEVACGTVKRISDDRVVERGEVNADLMGSAGVKLNFHEGGRTDARKRAPVSTRFAGASQDETAARGHSNAAFWVARNREIDNARGGIQEAFDQSDVRLFHLTIAEGFAEFRVGEIVFRDENDAGGLFVEAMDDAGAKDVATL
jgi:hypothetical protein